MTFALVSAMLSSLWKDPRRLTHPSGLGLTADKGAPVSSHPGAGALSDVEARVDMSNIPGCLHFPTRRRTQWDTVESSGVHTFVGPSELPCFASQRWSAPRLRTATCGRWAVRTPTIPVMRRPSITSACTTSPN
jgi:hypothetical protein